MVVKNIAEKLALLYLITLPFYSLRFTDQNLSISLVILVAITVVSAVSLRSAFITSGRLGKGVMLYILVIVFSFLYSDVTAGSAFALIKTIVYSLGFFSITYALILLADKRGVTDIENAIIASVSVYFVFFLYVVVVTGAWSSILYGFSYWSFTYKVYAAINEMFFDNSDFTSKNIMRNTIGEIFALFSIVLLGRIKNRGYLIFIIFLMSLILLVVTFSRRGLIELSICFVLFLYMKGSLKYALSAGLFVTILYYLIFYFGVDTTDTFTRFENIANDARGGQFQEAFSVISTEPFFGLGYGAELANGMYVHNIVIGSWYMLGILGFLASLVLMFLMLSQLSKSILQKQLFGLFLVVPLVGSNVGSTVEGIFTPAGWLGISFYIIGKSISRRKKEANFRV